MPLINQFYLNPLQPAYRPEISLSLPVKLPYGGPTGVGGKYSKGTILHCVGGAAANEIRTLTITGSPTGGTFTVSYTADKLYNTGALAYNITAANLKTALEGIFGTGNVTVTGPSGGVYTITFGGVLAQTKMGGAFAVTNAFTGGSTPAIAWAVSTSGNAGAAQFEVYNSGGSFNVARAILTQDIQLDPLGGWVTGDGQLSNTPQPILAFFSGFFKASDLSTLDSTAISSAGWRLVYGSGATDTGAIVGVGV